MSDFDRKISGHHTFAVPQDGKVLYTVHLLDLKTPYGTDTYHFYDYAVARLGIAVNNDIEDPKALLGSNEYTISYAPNYRQALAKGEENPIVAAAFGKLIFLDTILAEKSPQERNMLEAIVVTDEFTADNKPYEEDFSLNPYDYLLGILSGKAMDFVRLGLE
jgi:hypothetical protein